MVSSSSIIIIIIIIIIIFIYLLFIKFFTTCEFSYKLRFVVGGTEFQ